ncbi:MULTISPECIES: gluconate operon transcriptional repressor GntR [Providencia]|uniref:gluconate operon transcriptional repressor GntR n=1 Tax=Providencia TaxID=586 RepID=UPI001BD51092|nr:gluconate operon transcriptional repressor GntR [Providencia rettgeri]ELR5071663.1 gluconate operon transcriptional repressor GntR [Providencia rettgeri]ELR5223855.1 gluconate operon transcriptional repressor GntR [Providencia rettgeri]MDX7323348.1 gluconate operon transcriptional repressor GntR [Providencia rettgeri]
MKKKRPSLQDVADQVGVTKMTVSRFLRNPEQVSEALRDKIAQAVEASGYIPNKAPDILSNATSHAIGVLLPSLTNQVFAEVIRGIEAVTDRHGYQTMLAHYGYLPEKEEERLTSLLSYNIDGVILAERTHTERTLRMLKTAGIPVVEIMDSISPCLDIAVGIDNFEASRQMTQAMIDRGCRKVVYLGARHDERTFIRLKGYEQAMLDANLEPRNVMTQASSSYSLGAQLLHDCRAKYPDTDGLFCTNDDLAIGAIFECQRLGIQIPQDLAISGFHGHDVGQVMTPKLASILTPRDQMGRKAAEVLLARMSGKKLTGTHFDVGFSVLTGESI